MAAGSGGGFLPTMSDCTDLIPGLAAHPDRLPASPNADDEEFDAAIDGAWTSYGASTAYDITVPSHLYIIAPATSSARLNGIARAIPSMPFTVTAKLAAQTLDVAQVHYPAVGLTLREAATGKSYHVVVSDEGDTTVKIKNQYWSSGSGGTITNGSGTAPASGQAMLRPVYLRWVVTDATHVRSYFSYDGMLFVPIGTASVSPGFTFDQVGFVLYAGQLSVDLESLWDWIRFT